MCIWVRDGERSKKHIALCYLFEVDFDAMKIRLDPNEFIASGNSISGTVTDIERLITKYNELEPWSKIILREFFNVNGARTQSLFFE